MCPPCFKTEVEEQFSSFTVTIRKGTVERSPQLPLVCCGCAASEGLAAAFVTAYPTGEERTDYFGRLCPACAEQVLQRLAFEPSATDATGRPAASP